MLAWWVASAALAEETPAEAEGDNQTAPAPEVIERIGLLPDQSPSWLVDAIEREQPHTQPHRLTVDEQDYLALLQPSQKPGSRGLVVLLPNRGQHADWPLLIRPVRNALSEHGWTVLALAYPEPSPAPPPKRPPPPSPSPSEDEQDEQDEQTAEQGNQTDETEVSAPDEPATPPQPTVAKEPVPEAPAPRPIPTLVDELSQQALALVSQPARNNLVFIGVGDGAYWASRWAMQIAANSDTPVPKLVLINARNQLPGETDTLPDFLVTPLPVLDLIHDRADKSAKLRRLAAQKSGFRRYRQQKLSPFTKPDASSERKLVNRLRGFID